MDLPMAEKEQCAAFIVSVPFPVPFHPDSAPFLHQNTRLRKRMSNLFHRFSAHSRFSALRLPNV
jgi:hypothetical protein